MLELRAWASGGLGSGGDDDVEEMQRREMRTLAASPDYVVGSVHALTEDGSLLIASASGSQLGPLALRQRVCS